MDVAVSHCMAMALGAAPQAHAGLCVMTTHAWFMHQTRSAAVVGLVLDRRVRAEAVMSRGVSTSVSLMQSPRHGVACIVERSVYESVESEGAGS